MRRGSSIRKIKEHQNLNKEKTGKIEKFLSQCRNQVYFLNIYYFLLKLNMDTPSNHPRSEPHISKAKSSLLIDSVHQTLQQQLKSGQLIISQSQKPLTILRKQPKDQQTTESKLKYIQEKKYGLKKQLDNVNAEEENLKMSQVVERKLEKSRMKVQKSELSAEDAEHLKRLVAAHRQFEKDLQKKTECYNKRMKKIQQQKDELLKKKQEQLHEKKKRELEHKIEQMDLRRKQQQEKFDVQKSILKAELTKKRMYEEMQEKWKERQKQESLNKTQIAQQLRKMKNIDFEEIKEHSRKYDETMKAQRESRVNVLQSSNAGSFYHSNFRDAILEEEQRKKEEQYERQLKVLEFFEKRKAYGQQVRVNHKPMVKNQQKQSSRVNKENSNKTLSLLETHKRGNQYMKSVNTSIAQMVKENPDKLKVPKNQELKTSYKNYLQELRRQNNGKHKTESDEVQQILKNSNLSEQDKLFKMKLIAQKMQNQNNRQSLMKSINLKLKILQEISPN